MTKAKKPRDPKPTWRSAMYEPGATLRTLDDVLEWLISGRWVILRGRPLSPGFLRHMTLKTISKLAEDGSLRRALPTDDSIRRK